jgi:hypothetical protein
MKALARYPFSTTSITTIELINHKELQQQIEQGTLKPVESYIIRGEGPVKPILTVEDKQPVAITGDDQNPRGTTVVALQIENTGSGFLKDGEISKEKIRIDFRTDKIKPQEGGECTLEEIGNNVYRPKEDVVFIRDKSPKLFCVLEITEYVPKITTNTITVTITDYEYEVRASEKVTVEPKF